jgi:Flp pilus assembly protein TadD
MLVLNKDATDPAIIYGVRSISERPKKVGLYRGPQLLIRCGPIPPEATSSPIETVLLDRLPTSTKIPLSVKLLANKAKGPVHDAELDDRAEHRFQEGHLLRNTFPGACSNAPPAFPDITVAAMSTSAPTSPLNPANESEIVLRATELVSQGELEQAEQLLRQLVNSGSTLAKAWMNLGVLVGDRGDKVERLKLFNHARELDPNNAKVLLNLAIAYHENGDSDSAEALIRQVLHQDAQLVAAHHSLGVVLAKAGRASEAREALATALELDPAHWQSLDQLTGLKSAAALKLAEAGYRRLIDAEPENGSLHRKLAVNLKYQNRISEAIESFRTALNLNAADKSIPDGPWPGIAESRPSR